MTNNRQNNFRRIAENRKRKIIDLIASLHNLSNTSYYEYTSEQIEAIFDDIQSELDKQKNNLMSKKDNKKKKVEL